jgi:serine phosphatase RsbU (regulator of sigma subunit)
MKLKFLLIIVFAFIQILNTNLFAQISNVDSCIQVLKNAKEDTNKVILLDKIAWDISYGNLQKGIDYSKQSYELAKKIKYERAYAKIYNTQGAIYTDMGELSKALNLFIDGLEYAKKYNQYAMQAKIYCSLGNLYNEQDEKQKTLAYYMQSADLAKKIGSDKILYIAQSNIAFTYIQFMQLDSAKYYVDLCIAYNTKNNNEISLMNNYILLSDIYYHKNDKIQCLFSANQAVQLAKKNNDKYTLSHAYFQMGRAQFINNEFIKAIDAINQSISYANQTGDIQILESDYQLLSNVYEKTNDFKNSLLAYKQFTVFKDSSLNVSKIQQIKNSEAKYQNEKKQKEIELLGEKQKLNEAENQKKKVYLYSALFGIIVLAFILVFLYRNNISKQKTNSKLESFNKEIHLQKELVEEKNKEITDSINYALRIQQSILTSDNYFKKHTNDFFILFKPKDIVSGDFYWALNHEDKFTLMTADCTGHGVPGAMMSMMGINFLNEIVNEKKILSPAEILNQLRKDIIKALNPEGSIIETKDGLDCCLCIFDFQHLKLSYANANNNFYIIRNNELITSESNKMPVGAGHNSMQLFKEWQIDLQKNDIIITLTDGYADQFGGPKGKKFKYKQLESMLLESAHLPLSEIKNNLDIAIDSWKGELEQVDDICIIGIKV